MTIEQRLLRRSARADDGSGCLRWVGSHHYKGYGRISVDGKVRRVHRVAYQTWVGPIPPGYDIDHVAARGCAHRDCIEPAHLEAVTHAENVKRRTKRRAPLETCYRGHPWTPESTRYVKFGRLCRICNLAWRRADAEKKAEVS